MLSLLSWLLCVQQLTLWNSCAYSVASVMSDSKTLRAHQAPLSMGASRQEYWNGLPCPSPGNLLTQGSNPSLLRFLHCRKILYCWATREALTKLIGNQKASVRRMASKLLTFSERKEGMIFSQDALGMSVHFFLHLWFNHFKQFWKRLYIIPFSALKQKGVKEAAVVLKKKKKKEIWLLNHR